MFGGLLTAIGVAASLTAAGVATFLGQRPTQPTQPTQPRSPSTLPRVIPAPAPPPREKHVLTLNPSLSPSRVTPAPTTLPQVSTPTPASKPVLPQSQFQTISPEQFPMPTGTSAFQVVHYDANNYIIPNIRITFDDYRPPFEINDSRYRTERFVLQICSKHASNEGCQIRYCFRFHVCHKWIRGICNNENCAFDHHFEGKQNVHLFNRVQSQQFGQDELRDRIRRNLSCIKDFQEDPSSCICMDYIFKRCKREDCLSYHVSSVYSWEIFVDNRWFQYSKGQNTEIENYFCDPSIQEVTLDSSNTSTKNNNVFRIETLFKNETMKINFRTMSLTISNQTVCPVRRLATPSDVTVFKAVATRWLWYWEDDDGVWNFYTNAYMEDIVIFPFSDYIEIQFLKKILSFSFHLNCYGWKYTINFETMTQMNTSTGRKRKLQRRPMHSNTSKWKNDMTFTSLWTNLNAKQKYQRLEVRRTSPEFYFIQRMIVDSVPVGEIFIERVENSYLWDAFQLKKMRMMRMYDNDLHTVNEQYLFHGTSKDVVDKICSENLDWRLYGAKVGNVYGKGTYFASSVKISSDFATTDEENYKWIFVCFVLIGRATVGNPEMTLPPIDPVRSKRFDSTVNDNAYPQIYVKYNLDEYYPAYLIKFTTL